MGKTERNELDLHGFETLRVECEGGEILSFTQERNHVIFTRHCEGLAYVTVNDVTWLKEVKLTAKVMGHYGEITKGQCFYFDYVEFVGWVELDPLPGHHKYDFRKERVFDKKKNTYTSRPVLKVHYE